MGWSAEVSNHSFPANDFGEVEVVVKRIGIDVMLCDECKTSYRYLAEIDLKSQQLKLKSGKSLPLQMGMSLTANIKLRKVAYMQLLGSFKEKTESLFKLNQQCTVKLSNLFIGYSIVCL